MSEGNIPKIDPSLIRKIQRTINLAKTALDKAETAINQAKTALDEIETDVGKKVSPMFEILGRIIIKQEWERLSDAFDRAGRDAKADMPNMLPDELVERTMETYMRHYQTDDDADDE